MSGKVSAELNTAINNFLETSAEAGGHIANKSNPHEVTKTQVGLGNVTNEAQATKTEFVVHTVNVSNPHSVTKTQVGLSNVINEKQATEVNFNAHAANVNNPHSVTKTQVGLGNVLDEEQTTTATYNAHIAGTADKHNATDIVYDETHSVKEFVDNLALESGTGTMDHSQLLNRNLANAHPITAITGLSNAIGHETYTFYGETPDATEVELLSTDAADRIDANGRLQFTAAETLAFEAYIICGAKGNPGIINGSKLYKKTGILRRVGQSLQIALDTGIEVGNITTVSASITANNASSAEATYASMSIKVSQTGTIDLGWKAIVKVMPLSASEFE